MRCFTILAPLLLSSTLALGQFGPGVPITSQFAMPTEIMAADLDGDLELDVVMRNAGAIVWSRNLGQGSFGALDTLYASNWTSAPWLSAFDLADVDMDGAVDLVVLNRQDSLIAWLPNVNGTGSFGPAQPIADLHGQGDLGAIRCTNIMADAFPDVIVNSGTFSNLSVHINDGGSFTTVDSFNASGLGGALSRTLVFGDLDLNGTTDLVHQHWSGQVWAMLNSGGELSTWTDTLLIPYAGGANFYGTGQLQLIDVDGDDDLDVADAANDNTPVWAEGFAVDSGGFHRFHAGYIGPAVPYEHTGWAAYLGCGSTASALWSSGPDGDTLNWSLFDSQLDAFGPSLSWVSETGVQLIRTADLNGDGSQDLILAHADTVVTWYPNLLPAVPPSSIELTPFDTLCAYGDPYALDHALPQGGVWNGEGVIGTLFSPPGSGTFSLTYQVVDAVSGCPLSAVQSIAAVTTPVITLVSGNPDECALDPLQYEAAPAGGLWSGIAESDGSVDRSCAARPNSGEIFYAMNAANGGECFANSDNISLPGCLVMSLGPDVALCTNGDTLHVIAQGPSMGGADITGCDEVLFTPPSSVQGLFYPNHAPGDYVITAMVFGANLCPGYDTLMVTVVAPPEAIAGVLNGGNPALACQNELLVFSGTESIAQGGANIQGYQWTFGGGQPGAGEQVDHVYVSSGAYEATLTVTDSHGCVDTTDEPLVVHVSTTPSFTGTIANSTVCQGDTFLLTGVAGAVPWGTPPLIGQGAAIPDLQGVPFTSTISISTTAPGQVVEDVGDLLSVCATMEHSYMGDLVIQLSCPNGQTIVMHQQGGGGTYIGVPVDDESETPGTCWDYCWSPTAANGTWAANSGGTLPAGTYQSVQSFTNLLGCPLNGDWTLTVVDLFAIDNGFLCEWSMSFSESVLPNQNGFIPILMSFQWIGPDILSAVPDPSQATAYAAATGPALFSFEVIDDFGCTYDTSLTVSILTLPDVSLTAPVAVDIDGGSVTFDGGTPPGGSYMIGDDETSTVDPITYNVGDSIVVVYSYTEPLTGCTGSDTAYVLVEQITSIDAAPGGTVVHVAPNPAHGHCIVRLAIDDVGRFTLLDALGRTARAWAPRRTPALLDLSGLPGGSYLLRVETPEGSTHHRLALE